ncbi:uncharacterized protein N7515_008156 [Penicillium bovifimosum]|uniref:Uncharacterized protein n=1 Tax=Penicillium bovifimosum TaxID=126998 RepID=A0A9W9KXG3_9EURO|nr:uncharacterized protein N7515_008156 [Penicillium bovifimosum]KAJ5124331.1 hypothetical protein N7515_008156 [Penicillium bovifimosum]
MSDGRLSLIRFNQSRRKRLGSPKQLVRCSTFLPTTYCIKTANPGEMEQQCSQASSDETPHEDRASDELCYVDSSLCLLYEICVRSGEVLRNSENGR